MTDLLGKKLVTVIIACLLCVAALSGALYYYVLPEQKRLGEESQSLQGQIRGKQAEIDKMRFEFSEIQKQIDQFKVLQSKRFFNAQDRITARDATIALMRSVKLIESGTEFSFLPAALIANSDAEKAGYKLLSGPMNVKFSALNDIDAYKFIVLLQRTFPGYLQMKSFNIQRDVTDIDDQIDILKEGKANALVSGSVAFAWWTMASDAQLQADPKLNPANITTDPAAQPPQ